MTDGAYTYPFEQCIKALQYEKKKRKLDEEAEHRCGLMMEGTVTSRTERPRCEPALLSVHRITGESRARIALTFWDY